MPRKPPKGKSLAEVNPEFAKEWHPTENGELTAFDVSTGSKYKAWWKCPKEEDHIWEAQVASRSNGTGCPFCSKVHKVVLSNCLATVNPELAKEWHPTKNGSLTPFDVSVGMKGIKAWWKCDKGEDHEWESTIRNRHYLGHGCSICSGKKNVPSVILATLYPKLAKEWHPSKNGTLTPFDVIPFSHKKVWWKCENHDNHLWKSTVGNRSNGTGCPFCSKVHKVVLSNCLATVNPELAKEWHPTKNGSLTPFDVSVGMKGIKAWWKCDKGEDHEWESLISNRHTLGHGCSICTGKTVVPSVSLATLYPKLAKEWHPTKNDSLTPFDVTPYSGLKVWWKCSRGDDHEWKTTVAHRAGERNCPYCTLTPQSRQELTITFELKQFFEINPKGFKTRINGKLWSIDIYLSGLNLGVEFDGNYWHKDKRTLDKLKTEQLQEDGFQIMRIREEPLKPITEIDVMSKLPFNPKDVVNDILRHILLAYPIDAQKTQEIKKYLKKKSIQNEEGLDDYIEMILTEKAERKKSK